MDDNKNVLHDIGAVLSIIAYTLLLTFYFHILGLIISISTIVVYLIIFKNVKTINDLLLKIKRIPQIKISLWGPTVIMLFVLVLVYNGYLHPPNFENSKSMPSQTSTFTPTVSPTSPAIVVSTSIATPKPNQNGFTNSIGMEFVLIPAGEFDMGSPESEKDRDSDEGPIHRVKISKAFYIGKYEVTQKQWREVMESNPSYFKGDNLPVEQVSWEDIQEFIKKLNEKEGTNKYRLPSEAEWEYSARAGTTTRYSFGDYQSMLDDYAWYDNNSDGRTHEVGQKKPNPWGLYDMYGNVWEWMQDKYHYNYNGAPTDGSAWEGDSPRRVVRGCGYSYPHEKCRSAFHDEIPPSGRDPNLGFRLVRVI